MVGMSNDGAIFTPTVRTIFVCLACFISAIYIALTVTLIEGLNQVDNNLISSGNQGFIIFSSILLISFSIIAAFVVCVMISKIFGSTSKDSNVLKVSRRFHCEKVAVE
jgi:high-affinity nickel permease